MEKPPIVPSGRMRSSSFSSDSSSLVRRGEDGKKEGEGGWEGGGGGGGEEVRFLFFDFCGVSSFSGCKLKVFCKILSIYEKKNEKNGTKEKKQTINSFLLTTEQHSNKWEGGRRNIPVNPLYLAKIFDNQEPYLLTVERESIHTT